MSTSTIAIAVASAIANASASETATHSLWRMHKHSDTSDCKCCPSPSPKKDAVVVKRRQSPIDIHEGETDMVPLRCPNSISISMGKGNADLDYDGHGFRVSWAGASKNMITISGKVFHAVQFHFHTPSEHTLDGRHEELEVHFVHKSDDGMFAVIGVLFREGDANPFLAQFWDKLGDLKMGVPAKIPVGVINPEELNVLSSSSYHYRGSLTTPPYTEGVEWVVIHDVMEASREQLDAFHRALPGTNAREIQPLNHRHVLFTC